MNAHHGHANPGPELTQTPAQALALHHVSVLVSDLEVSRRFYVDLLGLRPLPRPELGFPGLWLDLGQGQALHLLALPNPDPVSGRPEHGGRDRHVALAVPDLAAFCARLDAAGAPYTQSRSGRPAVFVRDPDGNAIELIQT